MAAPLTLDELKEMGLRLSIRGGVTLSSTLTAWLTANTVLPRWLAEEIASWVAVAAIILALVASARVADWIQQHIDTEEKDTHEF